MMSSSESDEEEARRISEAVSCNESRADLFATKTTKSKPSNPKNKTADSLQSCTSAKPREKHLLSETDTSANGRNRWKFRPYHETVNVSGVPLKSNRPQVTDVDDDVNNRLAVKTTPEFRAFVAKHLEKQLDKELETCLTSSVWSCLAHNEESEKLVGAQKRAGVKLLSDSKNLLGDNPGGMDKSQTKAEKNTPVKKPRLSTSSESSEDERIQACIFTVNDIEAENKILASLAKKDNPETQEPQNISHECPSSEKNKVENLSDDGNLKKAKKKKKKKKNKIKETHVS